MDVLRFPRAQNIKHFTDANAYLFFCIALTGSFHQIKTFRMTKKMV